MTEPAPRQRLDAPSFFYEAGRQVQSVAMVMRRHKIVTALGICQACGRPPLAEVPWFGTRCEVAVHEWHSLRHTLGRLVGETGPPSEGQTVSPAPDSQGANRASARVAIPQHRA